MADPPADLAGVPGEEPAAPSLRDKARSLRLEAAAGLAHVRDLRARLIAERRSSLQDGESPAEDGRHL